MKNTQKIVIEQNKLLEQRLLQSIKKLPKYVIETTCVNDTAFNDAIIELSQNQNTNLKKLLNEI